MKACENLKRLVIQFEILLTSEDPREGISSKETAQAYRLDATNEVTGFIRLQVDPELSGREMLEELLKAYPEGIREAFNGIRLLPKEVATLIRNKNCHAVYVHPLKRRFFFASKLHKEVAEAQLGNPRPRNFGRPQTGAKRHVN